MNKKKLFLAFTCCLSLSLCVFSQPYLDLARVSYTHNPNEGLNKKTNPAHTDLYSINLTLPIELKKNGDAIIINPFYDHNKGEISNRSFSVISEGISLGFLNKLKKTNWSVYTAFILRKNKEAHGASGHDWQYGGVALASHEKNKSITLKFGLYYNKEFFGNYFMPLAGLYWKINKKNSLFGVLPGNLDYEHKINERFYYGAIFRAATNSYRRETIDPCFSGDCSSKNYLRIDENQLGLFMDIYLSKNIVFNGESGYTLFRRYRFGTKGEKLHSYINYKNDNTYFKLSINYRMRFK